MYKYATLFVTLIYIDLFGLLPRYPAVHFLTDLILLGGVSNILFVEKRRDLLPDTLLKSVKYLSAFLGFYIFYTFIQGGVTLVDLYKMVRIYIPLLLTILISYDIIKNRNKGFYIKILFTSGCLVTLMIFLIGIVKVEWFAGAPRLSYGIQKGEYDFGLRRVYLFSSFVMVIACFVYSFTSYLSKKKQISSLLLFIFTIGFLLQGYRSYIIATILSIGYSYFLSQKENFSFSRKKKRRIILAAIIFISLASLTQSGQGLFNRIKTGITDLVGVEGTFGARLAYDAFRFQILLNHPGLGIGLVHQNSERAQQLGAKSFENIDVQTSDQEKKEIGFYALRSTDSGYLDIFVQFGLLGGIVFYSFFLWLFRFFNKVKKPMGSVQDVQAVRIFILLLLITQISHSGFANEYGLVPLSFMLGFAFGELGRKTINGKYYLIYEGSSSNK